MPIAPHLAPPFPRPTCNPTILDERNPSLCTLPASGGLLGGSSELTAHSGLAVLRVLQRIERPRTSPIQVLNAYRASGTMGSDEAVATGVPVSPQQQQRPVASTPYPSSDPATPAYPPASAASPGTPVLSSSRAPESPGESDAVSPEMEAVLRMSREQFKLESTRKSEPVRNDQDIWASNEPGAYDTVHRPMCVR